MDEDYLQLDVNILQGSFLDAKLTKRAVFNKKGGLKKLVEFSLPRRKKDFMKKMDGISMIIGVMASSSPTLGSLGPRRVWDQLRGPDILRSVFWSSARRWAIFLGGFNLRDLRR